MAAIRIRIPLIEFYDVKPNNAKFNKNDDRFFSFFLDPKFTHCYPDYEKEMNSHTGDDLGLIEIQQIDDKKILKLLSENCTFLPLTYEDINGEQLNFQGFDTHLGNQNINMYLTFIFF